MFVVDRKVNMMSKVGRGENRKKPHLCNVLTVDSVGAKSLKIVLERSHQ